MDDLANSGPMRFFNHLADPRAENVRHRLIDMLVIALMSMICGADGWDDIEDFARAKHSWLATLMHLPHGVPSADTFRRVFSRLDPDALERCFMNWMTAVVGQSKGRLLAIDGKSLRRSFEHGWDKSGMAHMVSAFATHQGQVLAQLKTDGKGGELEAIRQLLGLIDLRGAVVTIDAIGCQKDIARRIVDGGGDYILTIKENQKALHHAVKKELDDMIRNRFKGVWHDTHQQVEPGHGRIETRRVWVTDELDWLKQAEDWAGLRCVMVLETDREVIGVDRSVERQYCLTTLPADAQQLGDLRRAHWGVENGLHHVLDVSFHEDDSRIRKGHGAENISRWRRIALNLLKSADPFTKRKSIKGRRKIAGWDHQFLINVVTGGHMR